MPPQFCIYTDNPRDRGSYMTGILNFDHSLQNGINTTLYTTYNYVIYKCFRVCMVGQ